MLLGELGHIAVPESFRDALGSQATLSAFNMGCWEKLETISEDSLRELVEIVRPKLASLKHLRIRSSQPLRRPVQYLPFSTRTRNAVSQNLAVFAAEQLTIGDVLSVPAFGARSMIEFACVIEAATGRTDVLRSEHESFDKSRADAMSMPAEIMLAFQGLAAYAAGERKLDTLDSILPGAPEEWPAEIRQLWSHLGKVRTRDLAGDLAKRYSVAELLARALAPIEPRLREIITDRVTVTERAITLERIGDRIGVTRERVRQLEKKALDHLERLRQAEFRPVLRRSEALAERLGVAVPVNDDSIEVALDWVSDDLRNISGIDVSFAKALLLWLAGPYKVRQDWLVARNHLPRLTLDALLHCQDARGLISDATVADALSGFGIKERYHEAWVHRLRHLQRVEGGYIHFQGSVLEKARALIRYHGRPLTVEEMIERIGSDSVRSVRQRLIDDPGFWRINKQSQFVIAGTAGYDEYTGITDEIVQEIGACGGQAPFEHLVEKLARVYGVKENSVIAYLNTPMFSKDRYDIVRIRDASEKIDVTTDISRTAACYRNEHGIWFWRVSIDDNIARGSGRLVPNAFAQLLGCDLGQKIEVDSECGPITVSWPLASTTGAAIGSLRQAIAHCNAEVGDYLFVRATKPAITFARLGRNTLVDAESGLIRLSLLLGYKGAFDDVKALEHIAMVLGISNSSADQRRMAARRLLQARGETDLAELIAAPTLTVDDYITNMKKLFSR